MGLNEPVDEVLNMVSPTTISDETHPASLACECLLGLLDPNESPQSRTCLSATRERHSLHLSSRMLELEGLTLLLSRFITSITRCFAPGVIEELTKAVLNILSSRKAIITFIVFVVRCFNLYVDSDFS